MDQVTPDDAQFVDSALDALRSRFPELVDAYLARLMDGIAQGLLGTDQAQLRGVYVPTSQRPFDLEDESPEFIGSGIVGSFDLDDKTTWDRGPTGTFYMPPEITGTLTVTDDEALNKLFGFTGGIHPPAGFHLTERHLTSTLSDWSLNCEGCWEVVGVWTVMPPTQDDLDQAAQHRCE